MQIVSKLIGFGLKQVLGEAADSATTFIVNHFSDHSQALPQALSRANERAWQALGIALAGTSFLERVKVFFADRDSKAIRAQVEVFLQSSAISFEGAPDAFRKACLNEMQQLKKQGHLSTGSVAAQELAQQAESWNRYTDITSLVGAAHRAMTQMAAELREPAPRLSQLLAQPTPGGPPVLVSAFAYFFRREVETDDELAQGLFFDSLRQLSASQAKAFGEVGKALSALGVQFDAVFEQLGRIEDKVDLLSDAVERLSGQIDELARKAHVVPGEVKPNQNITIHNERERALARFLLAEVRKLPPEKQNADDLVLLGDILRAAGLFAESKQSYSTAIERTADKPLQAAAFYKTYLDELEQKHWEPALAALLQAATLDRQYAPFPLRRYQPLRILGAGGFGTVFLCRDAFFGGREVAIKSLHADELERSVTDVFGEAHVLTQLQHPAIIGIRECSYADMDNQARPYLEMEYFAGVSLETQLHQQGPLPPADLCAIALQVARGMQVAHERHILHRDLKPDNILVRKVGGQWQVKIIDFGLALRQQTIRTSLSAGVETMLGQSVAGTLQYAPPEQMGGLPEIKPPVPVGPYSDVYAFGKLCCQALFQNTQPLREDWNSVPQLADLLEKCLHRLPAKRHQSFVPLVEALEAFDPARQAEIQRQKEEDHLKAEQPVAARERARQQEGETKLKQLIGEALQRSRGKPTDADNAACKQLVDDYQLPHDRARQLIKDTKERWLLANPISKQRQAGEIIPGSLGLQFAWIPPGRFQMGSPTTEAERDDDETQHWVTLTRGFYLGVHLVTQTQWQQVMGSNPSHFKGETRPVDTLSWDDCQEFCRKLSQLDGKPYRLPTEAEWEYACRAGTTTPFSFGDTISTEQVNYDGSYTYGRGKKGKYRQETTPVGTFPANKWNLYDMHGSLWEWCQDWYGIYPTADVEDPKGPDTGSARVLRGGSWLDYPWRCRSAYRGGDDPGRRYHYWGCRVCFCLD